MVLTIILRWKLLLNLPEAGEKGILVYGTLANRPGREGISGIVETRIRKFMEETFLMEFGGTITETTDLFKEGVIDSFGYVQLCRFLEREFEIKLTEQEMLGGVFVNLAGIRNFVAKKIAARSAA